LSEDRAFVDFLRRHLGALADGQAEGPVCPPAERVWRAVHGELRRHELVEVVEHVGLCGACAEKWRVAREMELGERTATEAAPASAPQSRPAVRWGALAAAAAVGFVLIGVGLYVIPPGQQTTAPVLRSGEITEIRSLVPEDVPLPRAGIRLRWTPGPEGSLYTVRIRTEDFSPLVSAEGLAAPEYFVPQERLLECESDRLLWQVVLFPPDGGQITSNTFFVELEPREP
jgi:hypothetical protein